jgi:hypothetical protein
VHFPVVVARLVPCQFGNIHKTNMLRLFAFSEVRRLLRRRDEFPQFGWHCRQREELRPPTYDPSFHRD